MTRMPVRLSLSVKVSWLSWFNVRVGIGNEEWISVIWLRGEWWLSLGGYVWIGGGVNMAKTLVGVCWWNIMG